MLPDGKILLLSRERFRVPEAMFQPLKFSDFWESIGTKTPHALQVALKFCVPVCFQLSMINPVGPVDDVVVMLCDAGSRGDMFGAVPRARSHAH